MVAVGCVGAGVVIVAEVGVWHGCGGWVEHVGLGSRAAENDGIGAGHGLALSLDAARTMEDCRLGFAPLGYRVFDEVPRPTNATENAGRTVLCYAILFNH